MHSPEIAKPPSGSPVVRSPAALSPSPWLPAWIGDRRIQATLGLAAAGSGLYLGWGWLTAVGIAPLIVSTAPCLVMCALGLCMVRRGQQACSTRPDQRADGSGAGIEPDGTAR